MHELLENLDTNPYNAKDWLSSLPSRKQQEADFHDRDRTDHADEAGVSRMANRKFYKVADGVTAYTQAWLTACAPGSVFLDFACGSGKQTIAAAELGATLAVGIDISEVSIRNAIANASASSARHRIRFAQRDCENTELPSACFDAALCAGVLHHMELQSAYAELARIMKPGGRVLCVEALGHNPVIQWYRDRTPHLRTAWERAHILKVPDMTRAPHLFDVTSVRYFNLTSPLSVLAPSMLQAPLQTVFELLDAALTRVPLVQRWSWMFAFELMRKA